MNHSVNIKQSAFESIKNIAYEYQLRIIEAIDQFKSKLTICGVLKDKYSDLRRSVYQ